MFRQEWEALFGQSPSDRFAIHEAKRQLVKGVPTITVSIE